MEWFIALLAVVVLGLAATASAGKFGEFGQPTQERPELILPEGDLSSHDIAALRLAVVPRGYAMDQVDEVLSRLAKQVETDTTYAAWSGTGIIDTEEPTGKG